jgi:hypothetical protein
MPRGGLTDEQRNTIRQRLIFSFQQQFGEEWARNLHKNLVPSPIEQIARENSVSVSIVKKIYADLKILGYIMRGANNARPALE